MKATAPRPHEGISAIKPYVGGKSIVLGQDAIKLSSNETPLGPSPKALAAARAASSDITRYPDGSAKALRCALADYNDIELDGVVCGAGSDEILNLLVRAYLKPGDEVLYSAHGFVVYPIATRSVGGIPIAVAESNLRTDVEAFLSAVTPRTRIIFIANPNNPTGSYISSEEVYRLHRGLRPDILLVLDAAYSEYVGADDYENGLELARKYENVVMTRTFSKAYGLAGLRVGWCFGAVALINTLNRVRGPFNVTGVSQSAAIAALRDEEYLNLAVKHNNHWRPWLAKQIAGAGFEVVPSVANFFLVRIPSPLEACQADEFLLQRGLILRRMEDYGLPDCLRLSVGTEKENHIVVEAFEALATRLQGRVA